jgi:hypothetical protein
MIDLTKMCNDYFPEKVTELVTFHVWMERHEICEALKHDILVIKGVEYKTPVKQLLQMIKLQLFEVDTQITLEKL